MPTCDNCGEPRARYSKQYCRACQDTVRKLNRLKAEARELEQAQARAVKAMEDGEHRRRPENRAGAQWADPPWSES